MKCSNKIISSTLCMYVVLYFVGTLCLTYTTVRLTVWCQIVQNAGAKQKAQI